MNDSEQNDLIYSITGKIFSMPYAWGGTHLIPETLGFSPEPGVPYAEYWLGTHPLGPSQLETQNGIVGLDQIIKNNPELTLGSTVAQKYDNQLPFLFKLLEAEEMLSIQVHPNKQQAEEGFNREQQEDIPATDFRRTYKDPNHKIEFAIALDDFWLLHGFREKEDLVQTISTVEEFTPFLEILNTSGYEALYRHVMVEMNDEEVNSTLQNLEQRIMPQFETNVLEKSSPHYWAAKAMKHNKLENGSYDRGIFSIYFLNLIKLKPGQAIFQDAGVLHAYLQGPIIEVMTTSDNIARGGLTIKRIHIEELMKLVLFKGVTPKLTEGRVVQNETFFDTPLDEYVVSKISLGGIDAYQSRSYSVEILIGMAGDSRIMANGKTLPLGKGKSVVVFAHCDYEITGSEDAVIYKTSIPQKEGM